MGTQPNRRRCLQVSNRCQQVANRKNLSHNILANYDEEASFTFSSKCRKFGVIMASYPCRIIVRGGVGVQRLANGLVIQHRSSKCRRRSGFPTILRSVVFIIVRRKRCVGLQHLALAQLNRQFVLGRYVASAEEYSGLSAVRNRRRAGDPGVANGQREADEVGFLDAADEKSCVAVHRRDSARLHGIADAPGPVGVVIANLAD